MIARASNRTGRRDAPFRSASMASFSSQGIRSVRPLVTIRQRKPRRNSRRWRRRYRRIRDTRSSSAATETRSARSGGGRGPCVRKEAHQKVLDQKLAIAPVTDRLLDRLQLVEGRAHPRLEGPGETAQAPDDIDVDQARLVGG